MFGLMTTTLPALATMYGADRSAQAQMYSAQQQAAAQAAAAASQAAGQQGAARYTGMGNAEAGRQSGLASAYGGYATGLAGLANAQANERSSAYGAMAQSEAARQLAAGNIANQALASYGGMGNAAMSAWGQNQSAYNQALASMFAANQTAASQLGQSRNQALAGLGGSMSQLGRGLAGAQAIQSMGTSPGGGFSAQSPTGPIASGSYGSGAIRPAGVSAGGMENLEGLRSDLNDNTVLNNLTAGRDAGMRQLDAQHYSSREMPQQFMGQALSGLMQLATPGYRQLASGMNQLYGNLRSSRPDFTPYRSDLASGFGRTLSDSRGGMNQFYDRMGSGGGGGGGGGFAQAPIPSFDSPLTKLIGSIPEFQSPFQRNFENLRSDEMTLAYRNPRYQPRLGGALSRLGELGRMNYT